eukprot:9158090-Pyramimonas_sp.AAC.1
MEDGNLPLPDVEVFGRLLLGQLQDAVSVYSTQCGLAYASAAAPVTPRGTNAGAAAGGDGAAPRGLKRPPTPL